MTNFVDLANEFEMKAIKQMSPKMYAEYAALPRDVKAQLVYEAMKSASQKV